MADIAKKIVKLDEKIGRLKERIQTDTAECEKLSEQKALLIYQSLCKQYSCEGQALADMIARDHEQAAMPVADKKSVSDKSYADNDSSADNSSEAEKSNADNDQIIGQTSFFSEERNPYAV